MAHYAFINTNSEVVEVITGKDEDDLETLPEGFASWEAYYETTRDGLTCKRTSYNTNANEHVNGGTAFRGNYAGIGFIYDSENDVFYAEQPYPSWLLNESTWTWNPPIPYPDDNFIYEWNESTQSWDLQE